MSYDKKWAYFKSFCLDEKLQEGNETLDPEADGEPSAGIVPKILDFFIYKVVEKGL